VRNAPRRATRTRPEPSSIRASRSSSPSPGKSPPTALRISLGILDSHVGAVEHAGEVASARWFLDRSVGKLLGPEDPLQLLDRHSKRVIRRVAGDASLSLVERRARQRTASFEDFPVTLSAPPEAPGEGPPERLTTRSFASSSTARLSCSTRHDPLIPADEHGKTTIPASVGVAPATGRSFEATSAPRACG
jgi:hypothetical protein